MADQLNTKVTVTGRFVGGALFEANEDGKHSACIVLDDGENEKVEAIRDNAIKNKWGSKVPRGLTDWTVREGDDEEYEASFDRFYINPKCPAKSAPKTVIRVAGKIEQVDEDIIYPGCYVAVSVNAYGMDANTEKKMKASVNLGLGNVMFLRDGERLGGGSNPEDDFGDFESEMDGGDFDDLLGHVA